MWDYEGYKGLFKGSGIAHERIYSKRPPPSQQHWMGKQTSGRGADAAGAISKLGEASSTSSTSPLRQEYDQARCAANADCRRFYRARSALYFDVQSELCRVLKRRLAPEIPLRPRLSSLCPTLR